MPGECRFMHCKDALFAKLLEKCRILKFENERRIVKMDGPSV